MAWLTPRLAGQVIRASDERSQKEGRL